jgi:DNA topoisomerase-1
MAEFWKPFKALVDDKMESVDRSEATGARVLGTDPVSGKPVSVRLGRYGPYAALGDKENDDEKLKFASLLPGQSMHTITLAQALELFKLPRDLGRDTDGEEISAGMGRFGPFVKKGKLYASIKGEDNAYTITLERARELIHEKEAFLANRVIADFGDGIQVLNGRYGPYITNGEKNARIPKDREPKSLTLDECKALLEAAPVRRGRGAFKKTAAKKAAPNKAPAKKTAARKATAKKTTAKKTTARKRAVRKATAKAKAAPRSGTDTVDAGTPPFDV